jgi:hypothetical protein
LVYAVYAILLDESKTFKRKIWKTDASMEVGLEVNAEKS